MKVLILGGYGLIGREITRLLVREKIHVTGIARPGRSRARGNIPGVDWIVADLRQLTAASDWTPLLAGCDAVINASGALQSGGSDNLAAGQRDAICALIEACDKAGVGQFVQISAPGASTDEPLEFLATKGAADEALRQSAMNWVILKPGLVIAATAYGGTSLIRMLAGFPLIQPLVLAGARVQCVGVGDVARAALRALNEEALWRKEFDLVEPDARSLEATVLAFRRWLGFAAPLRVVVFPRGFGRAIARLADLAGRLGWRAPLRSTSLAMIEADVIGDPAPWRAATGETLRSLPQILADLPATLQERLFARARLVFPVAVLAFSLFWIASGLVGLLGFKAAVSLVSGPLGERAANLFVLTGSIADIAIGVAIAVKPWFRAACFAAALLSVFYLAAGTFVTPALWTDPLGPFVKILPVILLALVLAALGEDR